LNEVKAKAAAPKRGEGGLESDSAASCSPASR
jgi:hypothetical protein